MSKRKLAVEYAIVICGQVNSVYDTIEEAYLFAIECMKDNLSEHWDDTGTDVVETFKALRLHTGIPCEVREQELDTSKRVRAV